SFPRARCLRRSQSGRLPPGARGCLGKAPTGNRLCHLNRLGPPLLRRCPAAPNIRIERACLRSFPLIDLVDMVDLLMQANGLWAAAAPTGPARNVLSPYTPYTPSLPAAPGR